MLVPHNYVTLGGFAPMQSRLHFARFEEIHEKVLVLLILLLFAFTGTAFAESALPRSNTVTMIDLGAKSCVPCKMMAPILEKLETECRKSGAQVWTMTFAEKWV